MPVTLNNLNTTPRSDTLSALQLKSIPVVATIGAGVANTTVQNYPIILPFQYKIRKVSVLYTAIDAITGGADAFNIVLGTGAYAQGNPAPNDNSYDPSTLTTVGVNGLTSNLVLGGVGYPTNPAVAGQSVFAADVPFTFAGGGTYGAGANPGNGWITLTTTGGYGIFIPTNYDAVYPEFVPITVRVATTATTGAISNLQISLAIVPMRKRVAPPGAEAVAPLPGYDY